MSIALISRGAMPYGSCNCYGGSGIRQRTAAKTTMCGYMKMELRKNDRSRD